MKLKLISFFILSLVSLSSNAKYANAEAYVGSGNIFINSPYNLTGHYEYGIQNNTSHTQTYLITYLLCAERKACINESFKVNLASSQRVQKKFKIERPISYKESGSYRLNATLKIEGESSHEKIDNGTLNVYNK